MEIIEGTPTTLSIVIPPPFEGELSEDLVEAISGGSTGPPSTLTAYVSTPF